MSEEREASIREACRRAARERLFLPPSPLPSRWDSNHRDDDTDVANDTEKSSEPVNDDENNADDENDKDREGYDGQTPRYSYEWHWRDVNLRIRSVARARRAAARAARATATADAASVRRIGIASRRSFRQDEVRDGWVFDRNHKAFFPPSCAKTGTRDIRCKRCGHKKDKDSFFADENGDMIKFERQFCINCLKRAYAKGTWTDMPTPPWEKDGYDASGESSDDGMGGGAAGASNEIVVG